MISLNITRPQTKPQIQQHQEGGATFIWYTSSELTPSGLKMGPGLKPLLHNGYEVLRLLGKSTLTLLNF